MYAQGIYHVAGHGSDDRVLFEDDDDRRSFLDHLETTFTELGLGIVSYLLMTNHHHLLVHTPDTRIEDGLRALHGGYSRKHNRRHGRTAHLFRAHSLARRIEDDADLIWTDRYIACNPVAAGMVLDPFDWPWGSAAAHAGLAPLPVILDERPLRGAYESPSDGWRRHYRGYISGNKKDPVSGAFRVAGAGFEPATSGL
jgi:putative transposase